MRKKSSLSRLSASARRARRIRAQRTEEEKQRQNAKSRERIANMRLSNKYKNAGFKEIKIEAGETINNDNRGKHKNSKQMDILFTFMSKNVDLATGYIKDRLGTDTKWEQLREELNAAGPPFKDATGWKRIWVDWKAIIRKKLAVGETSILSIEHKVASLCGLYDDTDAEPSKPLDCLEFESLDESSQSEAINEDPQNGDQSSSSEVHRGKHRSAYQGQLLFNFMAKNHHGNTGGLGKFDDRLAANDAWEKLKDKLNAAGPPCKDVAGWKKSWLDWKFTIRKKMAAQRDLLPVEQDIATMCALFEEGEESKLSHDIKSADPLSTSRPIKREPSESLSIDMERPKRMRLRSEEHASFFDEDSMPPEIHCQPNILHEADHTFDEEPSNNNLSQIAECMKMLTQQNAQHCKRMEELAVKHAAKNAQHCKRMEKLAEEKVDLLQQILSALQKSKTNEKE